MKVSIPKLHSIKFKTGPFAENVDYPIEFERPENLPVVNVLQGAMLENLRSVVLVGYREDHSEYIAGTVRDPKIAAFMFSRGHLDMLRRGDGCPQCETEDGDPAA